MVKTLGVIFCSILLSVPIMYLDHRWGNGFLLEFFKEQAVGIVATVLALNIATITFLLGHLVTIENKVNKSLFSGTKREVRDNVYFMAAMFVVMFVAVTAMNARLTWSINSYHFNPLVLLALVAFILVFACLFEIVEAIFKATKFVTETKSK